MTEISESSTIPGVKLAKFRIFSDARGQFMETFRKDWFPERSWEIVQSNRSESAAGVLPGLHFHHRQVDYWQVVNGSIRVALADLRRQSPAYGQIETIDLDAANPRGLFIPVGVAHGFLARTAATLLYLVDNYADACYQSKLYNYPAWPATTPDLLADGGWVQNDPFGSEPPDKLMPMINANDWTVNLGWPGPANAAMGEIFNLPTIPNMMARAATGLATPEESVAQAEKEIQAIFEKWRSEGLVGGGS